MTNYSDRQPEYGRGQFDHDEIRQAVMLGHVRYVLGISLTLAVVAGLLLFLAYL